VSLTIVCDLNFSSQTGYETHSPRYHPSLKPENNVMLCSRARRGGTIKLIDMGCAMVNETSSDGTDLVDDYSHESLLDVMRQPPPKNGTTGYWSQ
jgi:hypothetical protein